MNWIYDKSTPHSRLMVAYDRYGITIREWTDDYEQCGGRYHVHEGFYNWEQFKNRDRSYSGDDGSGTMKHRIVMGAISLMGHWGPSSDTCGEVNSLSEYFNGAQVFRV